MGKYRKALFNTNDRQYPTLFLREDGMYILIDREGNLTGDGFYDAADVLKYFPQADVKSDVPSPDYLSYAEQARHREKSGFGM
jgi:hypothetical protein